MTSRDAGDEALREAPQSSPSDAAQGAEGLQRQEQSLQKEIVQLQDRYDQLLQQQSKEAQVTLSRLVDETLSELSQRRQTLQMEVEQLERQRDKIQAEMRSSFAGASQDLAVRVQGFKDYLVGSLQDLATAAEQLPVKVEDGARFSSSPSPHPNALRPQDRKRQSFTAQPLPDRSRPSDRQRQDSRPHDSRPHDSRPHDSRPQERRTTEVGRSPNSVSRPSPRSSGQDDSPVSRGGFERDAKQIRQILDQYRQSPDYYGTPWQLRRTFEPIHAKRVSQWFFAHGGRGSLKSMGSRLQNILVASAIISVLRMMRGDRVRILILSDAPGRLGEWRRGFQDCLGLTRSDFGAQQGIALFEAPEAVCQRADRLMEQGKQPLILIDNSEDKVHLSLLQYPLWLAFAPVPKETPMY